MKVRIETSNGDVHHHECADVEIDNAALYVRDLITVTEEEPVRAGRGVVRTSVRDVEVPAATVVYNARYWTKAEVLER